MLTCFQLAGHEEALQQQRLAGSRALLPAAAPYPTAVAQLMTLLADWDALWPLPAPWVGAFLK